MVNDVKRLPADGRWAGAPAVPMGDDLAPLISRLRAIMTALSGEQPGVGDDAAWIHFDTALSGLQSALIALEEVQQGRRPAIRPAAARSTSRSVGWSSNDASPDNRRMAAS